MSHYLTEITRIKVICYANQRQLDTVIGMRRYLDGHVEKQIDLELLSRICFTSKFHLLRLFRKYYGQTPKQYLTEKRIEKAKTLLREGHTVTATCFEVGFDSPSSFSTLFKSKVGLPPIEFRKKSNFRKVGFTSDPELCTNNSKA